MTHPQVVIDPKVDIRTWGLSDLGAARVSTLAASGVLEGTHTVFCSPETKALQTARPLAASLGCPVSVHDTLGENDRSATGYLPPDEFEATADLFFQNPVVSVRGWETAAKAQQRVVSAFEVCLKTAAQGDVLFVGHGAVGTLLYCHLTAQPISRTRDQGAGGGGSFFEMDAADQMPIAGWQPIELLYA